MPKRWQSICLNSHSLNPYFTPVFPHIPVTNYRKSRQEDPEPSYPSDSKIGISFLFRNLNSDTKKTVQFCMSLHIIKYAVSQGNVKSMITVPITWENVPRSKEEMAKLGKCI
jgi:cystathionine beta-lyase/cystathionine gamma-synthase